MLKSALILLFVLLSLPGYADQLRVTVPIHKKAAGTYYLTGKLGNLDDAEFMVDTGSGYVVINQQSLSGLKLQEQATYVRDIKAILANGKKLVVPIWRISRLTLAGQCVLRDIEVAVFPGKTRQILGLTALQKAAPFEFSIDPPQIILSHCTRS